MKDYLFSDLDDEPEEALVRYTFGSKIDNKAIPKGYKNKPLIAYEYLDLQKTDYHFHQDCLDSKDIQSYFRVLKEFSSLTINDLINLDHKSHFHIISSPNKKLRNLASQVAGFQLRDENMPIMGQFALYTSKDRADRNASIKSPRIFFMIGNKGIFYILFYDPYHEIFSGTN